MVVVTEVAVDVTVVVDTAGWVVETVEVAVVVGVVCVVVAEVVVTVVVDVVEEVEVDDVDVGVVVVVVVVVAAAPKYAVRTVSWAGVRLRDLLVVPSSQWLKNVVR